MKRPRWLTREVVGWTAFDFANQAFTMVILTTMFQRYFIEQVVPSTNGDTASGKTWWAGSTIVAEILLIVISPIAGAIADFSGAKKRFLFLTYVAAVALTLSLALVTPGDVWLAAILFSAGYVFYGAGENFLNAFLPEIARQKDMGKVSAFSWTVAYCGALIAFAGAVAISLWDDGPTGFRLICLWAGLFYLAAGIPTFLLLRERKLAETMPAGQTMLTVGFHRLGRTFSEIKRYRQLFRYFLVLTVYFAGMQIVVFFAGTIAKELFDFDGLKFALFIVVVNITGVIGAAITGRVQDRIGARTTIHICLACWALSLLLAGFATQEWVFWLAANLVGLCMGALGTASRVMTGLFSPHHKSGEFFGFYGMAHKLSVILGVGFIAVALKVFEGRLNWAIAASSIFFLAGFALMFLINEREGRIVAIKAAREHVRTHRDYAGKIAGDVT